MANAAMAGLVRVSRRCRLVIILVSWAKSRRIINGGRSDSELVAKPGRTQSPYQRVLASATRLVGRYPA